MEIDKTKQNVSSMFDDIAPKYDFLNHFLSFGIDKKWRKKVRKLLHPQYNKKILDIATGTADLAIELSKLKPEIIYGIDISEKMIEIGIKKVKSKKLDEIIKLSTGDSLNINFEDNYFDAVTCSFGVRNFENLEKGLSEIYRVLKPNGQIVILEFSKPENKLFSKIYQFYFRKILPVFGRIISNSNFAYKYLPDTVNNFPFGKEFQNILIKTGFKNTFLKKLTSGIATIYIGFK